MFNADTFHDTLAAVRYNKKTHKKYEKYPKKYPTHKDGVFLPNNKYTFSRKMLYRSVVKMRDMIKYIISSGHGSAMYTHCENSKYIDDDDKVIINVVLNTLKAPLLHKKK